MTATTWFGRIAPNWKVRRGRVLFRERLEVSDDGSEELLSVSHLTGVTPRAEKEVNMFLAETLEGYKIVRQEDLVVNTMWAWMGAIGVSPLDGCTSPSYAVYRQQADNLDRRYLDLLVRSAPFVAEVNRRSKGIWASRLRLYPDAFLDISFPVPPREEQRAIARFLEARTKLTDQLIEKKQQQAALLAEREEATFLAVVTGATQSGPKTPSGAEWIGEIPAHWKTPKFTHVARLETGHTPSRKEESYWVPEECVIPWFSLADVWQLRRGEHIYVSDTAEKISQIGLDNSAARLLPTDTVILSRTASVGFPAILEMPMATTQDFVGWICGSRIRPKFLYYVLRAMKPEFRRLMMGSTHQTIYMPDIRSFRTPLPPLTEQDQIIAELDRVTSRFGVAAAKIIGSVEKLREYRASIITAVVTGHQAVGIGTSHAGDRARVRIIVGAEIVDCHRNTARFGRVKHQKLLYLAEAHAGIVELEGRYLREAAGPLDRVMIGETERGMESEGFYRAVAASSDAGVTYAPLANAGSHRDELSSLLGPRADELRRTIDLVHDFDTLQTEAIATLYAVWNDALMDGETPNDDAIVVGVLNDWHPEKKLKFKDADLRHWLGWMNRNGLVPSGKGSHTVATQTRDLFS